MTAALWDHLAAGAGTTARAWSVTRSDGLVLGFTDHDAPLGFDGIEFRPESGLSALALVQGTGLAVDNTEATGVLSSDAITEEDLLAGRFDGAQVRMWLVSWADPAARSLRFAGTLGEVRLTGGSFSAELRGLAEALNRPVGRLYQVNCSAVLGDSRCRVDLSRPGFRADAPAGATDGQVFRLTLPGTYPERWFERGHLVVRGGAAEGLSGVVKRDRTDGGQRVLELWAPLPVAPAPSDPIRLEPGCDKRAETCRGTFANMANFRGFPFIPGEDWLLSVPVSAGVNDGGPLR